MNDTRAFGFDGDDDAGSVADHDLEEALRGFANHDYRDRFWPTRRYEDQCDRIALRAFLPPRGGRLIEIGAGFGRLAGEYSGYADVVLFDPSAVMLDAARDQIGDDPRFTVMQGHAAELPFPDGSFDAVVCIRVIHHLSDPRPAIVEFARVLRPGGVLVLEYANKRNLKMIAGYMLRREPESPFASGVQRHHGVTLFRDRGHRHTSRSSTSGAGDPSPELWYSPESFIHAPKDIHAVLLSAGFSVEGTRSVSLLRSPGITDRVPAGLLVRLERVIQPGLGRLTPAPSIVVKAVRKPSTTDPGIRGNADTAT